MILYKPIYVSLLISISFKGQQPWKKMGVYLQGTGLDRAVNLDWNKRGKFPVAASYNIELNMIFNYIFTTIVF